LLVEGLGVGGETQLEEWLLKPADRVLDDDEESVIEEGQIKLFGPEESSWFATPITDESGSHALLSRHDSAHPLVDPMVTLLGSFQTPFDYNLTSHDVATEVDQKIEQWDDESQTPRHGDSGFYSDNDLGMVGDFDETLDAPLLSGNKYGSAKSIPPVSRNSSLRVQGFSQSNSRDRSGQLGPLSRSNSRFSHSNSKGISGWFSRSNSRSVAQDGGVPESFGSVGIGGGWQLAWHWEEGGPDGEEGGLKRVFLRGDGAELSHFTSAMSLPGAPPSMGEPEAFQVNLLPQSLLSISISHSAVLSQTCSYKVRGLGTGSNEIDYAGSCPGKPSITIWEGITSRAPCGSCHHSSCRNSNTITVMVKSA